MAYDDAIQPLNLSHSHRKSVLRWPSKRKLLPRRRKVPTVRLGGKKGSRGLFVVRLFRRIRLRWLKLQYSCMLKKLKEYYHKLVEDLIEASATFNSVQQQLMIETYYAVPVMGLSVAVSSANQRRLNI